MEKVDDFRDGLTASIYHQRNVLQLENDIVAICRDAYARAPSELVQTPITMAVRTNKLDYEYHAFLFAIRRTLEYLARGIAAYFGRSVKSFRLIAQALNEAEPADIADKVGKKAAASLPSLEDILSLGDARSPRDLIAHTRTEVPGTLNLTFSPDGGFGMQLAGGAERFEEFLPPHIAEPQLAERCVRVERLASSCCVSCQPFGQQQRRPWALRSIDPIGKRVPSSCSQPRIPAKQRTCSARSGVNGKLATQRDLPES